MAASSLFFFREPVMDDKVAAKHLTAESRALLAELAATLSNAPEWNAPALHTLLQEFAAARTLGLGKVAQPLRVAVTGGTVSPPIDATLALLGRERVLARLQDVLAG
jgi:glutamyl-tRNA synthetase